VLVNSFSLVISTFQNDVFACSLGAFAILITSIVSIVVFQAKSIALISMVFSQGSRGTVAVKLGEQISKISHKTISNSLSFKNISSQLIFNDLKLAS
jgi:hypothetical protein